MKATDEMAERVGLAICGCYNEVPCSEACPGCKAQARVALSSKPATPTLPAEPPEGHVRVRAYARVWLDNGGGYYVSDGPWGFDDGKADAILVADVKPLSPPVVAAVTEGPT
jgi:hypothetical protein